MITKTDGFVLKSMRYRDTSKIVTFYTRRFGKIKGIAKGARGMKSKFGAALEPLSLISMVLYKKEHRELQFISQCDLVRTYRSIETDLEKMAVGMSILELLNRTTHDEEENALLFETVRTLFEVLESTQKNPMNLLYGFQLRLGTIFGFGVSLEACSVCGRSLESLVGDSFVWFQAGKGALLCESCADGHEVGSATRKISVATAQILSRFHSARIESLSSIQLDQRTGNEVDETLRSYMRYHFEGWKPLKSLEVLQRVHG
jgi:DNA repair protein RecO (recombination protein O)